MKSLKYVQADAHGGC